MRDLKESFKKRVPLWFDTGDESTNMKIWSIIQPELEELHNINEELRQLQDIDQCSGNFVDIHGKNMVESRRGQSDPTYIKRIKGKYPRLKAKSDHDSVCEVISEVLGCDIEKIKLYSLQSRHLRVEITISDLTKEQAEELVISAKAHGVIVDEIIITEIDNVFRFSPSSEIIYNSENGFNVGKISSIL